jgi:hypothetical protein
LLPKTLAGIIAARPYTGQECRNQGQDHIARIEALRQEMTPETVRIFSDWCERRCQSAYNIQAPWFVKCIKAKDGRNQLCIWLSHWLAAFLINPDLAERL